MGDGGGELGEGEGAFDAFRVQLGTPLGHCRDPLNLSYALVGPLWNILGTFAWELAGLVGSSRTARSGHVGAPGRVLEVLGSPLGLPLIDFGGPWGPPESLFGNAQGQFRASGLGIVGTSQQFPNRSLLLVRSKSSDLPPRPL